MKLDSKDFHKFLHKANKELKKYGKEFGKTFDKYAKDITEIVAKEGGKVIDYLKQKVNDIDSVISDMGGIENFFKLMFSIEEEMIEFLTLDSIISWCKENRPAAADKAAILLLDSSMFSGENKMENCNHGCLVCFLDENDELIESKVKYFYATYMEKRLTETFGDKDMIILK